MYTETITEIDRAKANAIIAEYHLDGILTVEEWLAMVQEYETTVTE